MAETRTNDSPTVTSPAKMKMDDHKEDRSSKHDDSNDLEEEEFKMCEPSASPLKSVNPFGKSILKPSLLTVNPASPNGPILRQSVFNPFANKIDTVSEKKPVNGETVKFVPLLKDSSKPSETATRSGPAKKPTATASFVFGQNLQERVRAEGSAEPLPSTSAVNSNGNSSESSDMLFSSAVSEVKTNSPKESKSLTESAREYEESRANKRKYDEVQVRTGEEEETNILSVGCKLFSFDKTTSNWQERGRGNLRLNDIEMEDYRGSRLVFRATGSLRVILNTKIWPEMTVDKASEKSIRLTALDSNGEIKVFLIMCTIEDAKQLYSHLQQRLDKEVVMQKRKKVISAEK